MVKKMFEDLVTSIKNDKKKGLFILVALGVVGFGIFMILAGEKENNNLAQGPKKVEALPIPGLEDSSEVKLNKSDAYYLSEKEAMQDSLLKNSYDLSKDDYFAGFTNDNNTVKEDNSNLKENQSFNEVFGSNNSNTTKTSNHNQTNTNNNTSKTTQQVVVDTKRRRIPTDNGTMVSSNNGSSYSSSMIKAVVSNGNQPVKSGSTIRIRLSENCNIEGVNIPKNTVISGVCQFGRERVKIKINSIRFNNQLIATSYSVYEMDGIEGIYVPGGIKSEIVKDGANEAVDQGGAKVNTPIGTFGVSALKKGTNDPSVLIRDGHKIILKISK